MLSAGPAPACDEVHSYNADRALTQKFEIGSVRSFGSYSCKCVKWIE